ncbi:MAG: LolA family protein [Bacteroidota bacterium]
MNQLRLFPLLFSFLLMISGSLPAQDKKAQEILNGVSSRYKSYKSVKAQFTITVQSPQNNSKTIEKGTIFIKGSKYRLEIAGQEVISDGTTRWTFVKDANEVQIDNQRKDDNSITPTNIFTMYEKGWQSKFIDEKTEAGKTVQNVELVPVDPKKKTIFKVKLSVNKADKSILSAVMYDKNGSIQTIAVDKFTPEGVTDETVFVYSASKYPGAEVVDLR